MPRKALGNRKDKDETTLSVKLRLKKNEKKLLERAAELRRMESHDGKPPIAAVVVSSLRFAWKCLRDYEAADPHQSVTEDQALQSGLTRKGNRK